VSLAAALALFACGPEPVTDSPGGHGTGCGAWLNDRDGDGWCRDEDDCDDEDPAIFPGAEDPWYSGADEDCDGWDDFDADRDGNAVGDLVVQLDQVIIPDCDDKDALVHAGAAPICGNAVDDDCDGRDDCALRGLVPTADVLAARLIGGLALAAGDLDGDGVREWIVQDGAKERLVVAVRSGTVALETVTFGTIPNELGRTVGNVGGSDGDDLVVNDPEMVVLVYLDPELDTAVDGSIDTGVAGVNSLSVGDVTGDGNGDVVLGSDGSGRGGYVFAGPVDGPRSEADAVATLISTNYACEGTDCVNTTLGRGISGVGDLTGDGVADVAATVGASGSGESVAVFPGPTSGELRSGDAINIGSEEESFWALALTLDTAWDWNQDGQADLLKHDGFDALVYFGPILEDRTVASADATIGGWGAPLYVEWPGVPRPCGDINGDGWPDMSMLGEALNEPKYAAFLYGPFEGQFPAYLGADLALVSPYGDIESIVGVADPDGDGADDILLGVYEPDADSSTSELIVGLGGYGM
jgi:hypothetical protein